MKSILVFLFALSAPAALAGPEDPSNVSAATRQAVATTLHGDWERSNGMKIRFAGIDKWKDGAVGSILRPSAGRWADHLPSDKVKFRSITFDPGTKRWHGKELFLYSENGTFRSYVWGETEISFVAPDTLHVRSRVRMPGESEVNSVDADYRRVVQ